jgi:hypothetical protein
MMIHDSSFCGTQRASIVPHSSSVTAPVAGLMPPVRLRRGLVAIASRRTGRTPGSEGLVAEYHKIRGGILGQRPICRGLNPIA